MPDFSNYVGYLVGVFGGLAALYQVYIGKPRSLAEAESMKASAVKTMAEAQQIRLQSEEISARRDNQAVSALQDMTVKLTTQNGLIQTQLQDTLAKYHEQVMKNSDLEGQNRNLMRQLEEMDSDSKKLKSRFDGFVETVQRQQQDRDREVEVLRAQFREFEEELRVAKKKENGK